MTITWSHVSLSLINSLLDQEIIAFFCKGWNIYTVDIYRERKVATFCKSIADGEIIVKSCFEVVVDWQFTGKEIWDSLAPSKVTFLLQTAVWGMILTTGQLISWGKVLKNWCYMCKKDEEKGLKIFYLLILLLSIEYNMVYIYKRMVQSVTIRTGTQS